MLNTSGLPSLIFASVVTVNSKGDEKLLWLVQGWSIFYGIKYENTFFST